MPETTNQINIRSEEVQEILTAVPNWMIRWGNSLIFVLIIMLLAMSWFVRYPDIISSEVMITTPFPPEKLYANSKGKFEVLLINDGDTIAPNQSIAVMENSAFYKDVFLLKEVVDSIVIDQNHFHFPFESLPPLMLGDIAESYDQFEMNYSDYILNNELTPYKLESLANKVSLIEAKGRYQILLAQKELNLQELSFNKKELDRQKILFDSGIISANAYEQNQLAYAQNKRAYKNLEASISQIRELITNAQKNLKGTSIKQVQNNTRLSKKLIQSYYQLKKAIKDWEYKYLIQSSIAGQLSYTSYWSTNQSLKNGDVAFVVLPTKNSAFIGKIKAPATNSGKIKPGQRVQINLHNYPADEFGELNGKVSTIAAIPDDQGFYLIDVSLAQPLITSYGKTISFKHEMKGSAHIITEDLRLIERFFYQLKDII